jgi:hypothetical protein
VVCVTGSSSTRSASNNRGAIALSRSPCFRSLLFVSGKRWCDAEVGCGVGTRLVKPSPRQRPTREAAKYKLVDGSFLFVGPGVCPYPGLDCRQNGHAKLFRHGPAEPWASEVRSGLPDDEPLELPVKLDENGESVPDFDLMEQMLARAGIQVFSSDEEEENDAEGDGRAAEGPQYQVGETPGLSWAPVTPSMRARWAPAATEEKDGEEK